MPVKNLKLIANSFENGTKLFIDGIQIPFCAIKIDGKINNRYKVQITVLVNKIDAVIDDLKLSLKAKVPNEKRT